jgi:hypothetical protein
MSNVQDYLVNWKSWNDWFENDEIEIDDLRNLFEIIDDKCDDEVILYVFSQLKKNTLLTRFFVIMSWFSTMNILNLYVIEHKLFNWSKLIKLKKHSRM